MATDARDDDVAHIAAALARDFDGTCLLLANELATSSDPVLVLEVVCAIASSDPTRGAGDSESEDDDSGQEEEPWRLSGDLLERFLTEFVPQAVQLVLATQTYTQACAPHVNRFLQAVLTQAKTKLVTGDPCLLPSLLRILDEQRPFYCSRSAAIEPATDKGSPVAPALVQAPAPHVPPWFVTNVAFWGDIGGFALFLSSLRSLVRDADGHIVDTVLSFEAAQCIVRALYGVADHLAPPFLAAYAGPFCDALRCFVTTVADAEFHAVPREALVEVAQVAELVLLKVLESPTPDGGNAAAIKGGAAATDEPRQSVQLLQLAIFGRQLQSPSLEKRINGLSDMVALVTREFNAQVEAQAQPTAANLAPNLAHIVAWLEQSAVLDDVFGETRHAELIKRMLPLFQFASELERLDARWLDRVWTCYCGSGSGSHQRHEDHRAVAYDLLLDLIDCLDEPLLRALLGKLQDVRAVDASDLALLTAIAARSSVSDMEDGCDGRSSDTQQQQRLRDVVLAHLWTVVLPRAASDAAIDGVLDHVEMVIKRAARDADSDDGDPTRGTAQDIAMVTHFLRESLGAIASGAPTRAALTGFTRLALLVTELQWSVPMLTTHDRRSVMDELLAALLGVPITCGADDPMDAVHVRLLALRAAWAFEVHCRGAPSVLSRAQLDAIWERLIDSPHAPDTTASLCFAWLACCMGTSVARRGDDAMATPLPLLSDDLVEHLVVHKFASLSTTRMTHAALTCFQRLFEHLNVQRHGLALTTSAGVADESDDSAPCRNCLATGAPLAGLTQLWRLAAAAPAADVAADCITFLASLYLELTPDAVREANDDIRTHKKLEFVDTCMCLLDDAMTASARERRTPSGDAPVERIATVNRCVDLLRYFLDACDAAAGIDAEHELLGRQSDVPSSRSGAAPCGRKSWELENLEERLPHLEIFPSPMKDAHVVVASGPVATSEPGPSRRPSWSFRQHHALLDAIPDDDGDESSDTSDTPRDAVPVASTAWTRECSSKMAVAIEAPLPLPARAVITSPTLRVRPTLQWPQGTSPPRGPDLSTDDLSQALHDASTELPPLLYDGQDRTSVAAPASAATAPSPSPSKYSVASHVLANRDAYFDTLFQLVDWPEATSQRTWELLCRLPTNNALLRKMIRLRPLGSSSAVDWTDQLNTANSHRLLYALRLVEALLLPLDAAHAHAGDPAADAARRQWRERFVRLGGAYHLYETLLSWNTDHTSGAEGATASAYAINLRATCLAALVRTLTYVLRLASRRSGSGGTGAAPCAFDTRLFESSLPAFVEAIEVSLVRAHAMRVSMANAYGTRRLALSSQEEEAIQCSIQLFTAAGALDPHVLVWEPSKGESTQQQEHQCRLIDWLSCLLLKCPSVAARTTTLTSLVDLLAEATAAEMSVSASAFVERLVCDLSALAISAPDASFDVSQLFALLESVLRVSVPSLERLQQDAIVLWLKTHTVVQRLLTRLSAIVARPAFENRGSGPGVDERVVSSYLRVLLALVCLSGALREQALHCRPLGFGDVDDDEMQDQRRSDHSATGASVQWTLGLVLTHLLFGDVQALNAPNDAATAVLPVCTSDESRALAYALLVSLFPPSPEPARTDNSVDAAQTALDYVLTHHAAFQASVLETLRQRGRPWRFAPRDFLRDVAGGITHAGLVNPGCVCYMNALLQQLFLTPRFRDGLLATDCSDESAEWAEEIAQLQQLFVALAYSTRRALDPTAFALSHRDLDGEPTDVRVQMDADEFFCLLLDRLDTSLRRSPKPQDAQLCDSETPTATFLDGVFGGVLVHQVTTEHGDVSERDEKFFALSLDVSSQQTLTDSLAQYVQGETLDGANAYYCERLERKVAATKRVCVKTLPQTLVCHLKRFAFDFDTMEKRKVHDALEFPHELDLLPFTRDGLSGAFDATESIMYDLVGVVVHSGSADMGHYYSFIRDREAAPSAHEWLEFNDDAVRAFDVADLGPECFGGEEVKQLWDGHARVRHVQMKRRSAYMLVYERRSESVGVAPDAVRTAVVHPTLSKLIEQTQVENAQYQRVVDAFDPTYSTFAESLVRQTLALPPFPMANAVSLDAEASEPHSWTSHVQAAVLACQFAFGMASLRASAPGGNTALAAQETALLTQILDWVSANDDDDARGPETDNVTSTGDDDADRCAFSAWLLCEVVAPPPSPASASVVRSWAFDLVFLNEHNPELVNNGLALLATSVSVLTRHAVAGGTDRASASRAVLQDFYRTLLDLFYDREYSGLEVLDPITGGAVTLSSHATTSALVRIGAFLERCVSSTFTDAPDARAMTLAMLAHSLQFVDRLLFTLQTELTDAAGPSATPFRPFGVPRIRACTLDSERRILAQVLPLVCSDDASINSSHHQSRICGMAVDASLILSQTALTNIMRCSLDEVLAPVLVRIAQFGSAMQREKLLSLLMAVLEDLKTTHVQPVLRIMEKLLDAEERDVARLDAPQSVATARIHRHIFSASRGLLEAAAYYRDHETLQSYTYTLLWFCVMRGRASQLLQHVFAWSDGSGDALCDQLAWVPDWLATYVDPSGDIRRQRASVTATAAAEPYSNEETQATASVLQLLDVAALMFQRAVASADPATEERETRELNQFESTTGSDIAGLTLDDIVAEIAEPYDAKQRKALESSSVASERGPEVDGNDDDDDDEVNNSHMAELRGKDVARTRPAVFAQHRMKSASSARDRMYFNRTEA